MSKMNVLIPKFRIVCIDCFKLFQTISQQKQNLQWSGQPIRVWEYNVTSCSDIQEKKVFYRLFERIITLYNMTFVNNLILIYCYCYSYLSANDPCQRKSGSQPYKILDGPAQILIKFITIYHLLSFQKVCRILFFPWMSQHDVTFRSQTLIGCPDHCKFCFCRRLFETVKQSIQTIINLSD